MNLEKIKNIISAYFSNIPQVKTVYLHGSIIKKCSRNDSDIDIAIIVNDDLNINKLKLLEFSSDLEIKLGTVVDIGIVSSANLVYSKEVIENGICVYSNDENMRKLKEATLLSLYLDFQDERQEILNAYTG
ncbi:MAG: nucleotidyltransferase domain-containing protein [Victivallales bacterium]|nr:nucleotidyltransferase domain-containing protein [Victivallales bacterium]